MAEPAQYLPKCTAEEVKNELMRIGFPPAQDIKHLVVGGEFHQVFRLTLSTSDYEDVVAKVGLERDLQASTTNESADHAQKSTSFILRISGAHMPTIKTVGEVGIITYLTRHTTIPIPRIIHYDSTSLNALGNEYMIMTLCPGIDGSVLYPSLTASQMDYILDQLASICLELYNLDFHHIGGLKTNLDTSGIENSKTEAGDKFPQNLQSSSSVPIIPGPPILETMWHETDIKRYWHNINTTDTTKDETLTFNSLNAISPTGYPTYSAWLAAQMRVYMFALRSHPSLHWTLTHDPNLTALETFTTLLETDTTLQGKLNRVPLKLAHRDLHFGNLLLTPIDQTPASSNNEQSTKLTTTQYKISAILDWEFSSILPFPMWQGGFLYDGIRRPTTEKIDWSTLRKRKNELYKIWETKVRNRGKEGEKMLKDARWSCGEQEKAWDVVNYLRCVVEVCPRGKQLEDARRWWKEVERGLGGFGIRMVGMGERVEVGG